MTRLTLDEYKLEHDDADYPIRICSRPDVVHSFMIPFAEPSFLAGPFGGKYGLVIIRDASKSPSKLYTETEKYNRWRTYVANNLYNMPRAKDDQAGLSNNHEYLWGRYRADTLEPVPMDGDRQNTIHFGTRNTLPQSATLNHPFLQITRNSSSEIDGLDMLRLFRRMVETLPADEIIKRLEGAEATILRKLQHYVDHEMDSEPSLERPIVLTLCGNDDSSWGKVFASVEEALQFTDELELSARGPNPAQNMNFTN